MEQEKTTATTISETKEKTFRDGESGREKEEAKGTGKEKKEDEVKDKRESNENET